MQSQHKRKKADNDIPRGPGELLPHGKLNFISKQHNSLPNTSQPLYAFLQPNICYCCSFSQILSCVSMWVTECGGKHFVARIHAERCKTLDREKLYRGESLRRMN